MVLLFSVIGLIFGAIIDGWAGAFLFGIVGLCIGAGINAVSKAPPVSHQETQAQKQEPAKAGTSTPRYVGQEAELQDPAALRAHLWMLTQDVTRLKIEVRQLRNQLAGTQDSAPITSLAADIVKPPQEKSVALPAAEIPLPSPTVPVQQPVVATEKTVSQDAKVVWTGAAVSRPSPSPAPKKLVEEPSILSRLLSGNLVAKAGVIILFFGVGFLLKFAYDQGLMPPGFRVLAILVVATAMFFTGLRLQPTRRMYGLILQGGASGLAYLDAFFALKSYGFISPVTGFVIFTVLGISTVFAAVRQNAMVLAVLGIAGAFMAPILASSGQGGHLLLFSYYLLLNLFILGVSWFKSWRELNLTGFLFTFAVSLFWGMHHYQPELFGSVEPFVLAFFAIYIVIPVLFATRQPPELKGLVDGTLVFGVPAAVAVMQAGLVRDMEYGLAWSAAGASILYALLALGMRGRERMKLLSETYIALAVGLATMAVFFGFDAYPTFAIWTLEGAAILWVGLRQDRPMARVSSLLVQFAGAILFLVGYADFDRANPFFNDAVYGCLFITIAGIFSAQLLRRYAERLKGWESGFSTLMLWWAASWWSIGGLDVLYQSVTEGVFPAGVVIFFAVSLLTTEFVGTQMKWAALRRIGMLLPLILLLAIALKAQVTANPLSDFGLIAWPAGFASAFFIIYRQERDGISSSGGIAYTLNWMLLVGIASWEAAWLFIHGDYFYCMLLALTGHVAAYLRFTLRERNAKKTFHASSAALLWSGIIWYSAAYGMAESHWAGGALVAAMLVVVALTVLAYELAGSFLHWEALRQGTIIAWLVMPFGLLVQMESVDHPLAEWGWLAWPLILGVAMWILHRQESARKVGSANLIRGEGLWLVVLLTTIELLWWTCDIPFGLAWHTAAYCLPSVLALLLIPSMKEYWPVRGKEHLYRNLLLWPLYFFVTGWFFYANVRSPGSMAPFGYLPLLNPLDITVGLVLFAIGSYGRWQEKTAASHPEVIDRIVAISGFIWINAIALRTIHFWADVPYHLDDLMASVLVQATFSLLWAGTAMLLMIAAHQKESRMLWGVGAFLLSVVVLKLFLVDLDNSGTVARIVSFLGVGTLLLTIGYLTPVPPGTQESDGKD